MLSRPFGLYRAILAILVLVQHLHWVAPAGVDWANWSTGTIAVLAFFSLSGFVMTEAAERFYSDRPGAFVVNRALRILPQFGLAILLAAGAIALVLASSGSARPGMLTVAEGDLLHPRVVILNLLSILPGVPSRDDLVPFAWALRVEIAFYAALAAWIFLRARRTPHLPALAMIAAIALLGAYIAGGWGLA